MVQSANPPSDSSSYTAKDIQVLEGLEAVRRRPGMYIGSQDQRGLHHLIYEIVNNSIDEAMAGYCNRIVTIIHKDNSVTIEDNGRGYPIDIHPVSKIGALETVLTTLHSGAKFGGKIYQVSGGLHGVGSSVVNALSEWLKVDVKRDGKIYHQEFRRGPAVTQLTVVGDATGTGTTMNFLADSTIFTTIEYDFDTIMDRIREMAYLNKDVEMQIIDERKDIEKTFYFESGIIGFVRHLNRHRQVVHPKPIYVYNKTDATIVEVAMQYNDGFAETSFAFANCINTIDGGTHVAGFRSALTRVMNDYARKHDFIKENEASLTGDDVREGLTSIISVKLPEPQFEGQTKGKLGNQEMKGIVDNAVSEGLALYLEEHPNEGRAIMDKCLTAARAREAARKARELIQKKSGLDMGTLPGKLADCSDKDPSHCELYIVEGQSAGGSAKQGRNRAFQAILPLRGKILNVEKAAPDKMLSHEELRVLITALGTSIDDAYDTLKLRYHRVILMTDADVDGSHIRTLLLTFFFRHMPQLISSGFLYIAQPPLYRVKEGKTENWIYSDKELETKLAEYKETKKKTEVQRYKGLGEMTAEQLWETTMDPDRRTLLSVSVEDAAKADNVFHMLMGDEVAPRKAFIQEHAQSVKNLDI